MKQKQMRPSHLDGRLVRHGHARRAGFNGSQSRRVGEAMHSDDLITPAAAIRSTKHALGVCKASMALRSLNFQDLNRVGRAVIQAVAQLSVSAGTPTADRAIVAERTRVRSAGNNRNNSV